MLGWGKTLSEYQIIRISNDGVLIEGYANLVDIHGWIFIGLHPILTYAALSGLFVIHY